MHHSASSRNSFLQLFQMPNWKTMLPTAKAAMEVILVRGPPLIYCRRTDFPAR
ncbi:hypothetical protein PHET_04480 [Paragonimus heterotremus]|uniref:Uncharacterized protein n=1 Tax=Paragonimus heterotremus TaxID=100268 RepID=A0A8J4TIT0_9TREM|nr:hypothetical protein PHET_04480 [Paragonimus heterotremus]